SLRRADGTALGRVWESRLLPTLYNFMFGPVGRGFIVCTQGGCVVVIPRLAGPFLYLEIVNPAPHTDILWPKRQNVLFYGVSS
ncbi:hypothetical protein D8M20_13700, partial [Corynebacterium propinquum]